ncbi:MAG: T9SS type A sorting domain-containing protein [Bacteroidia bacterium]|nr:T9SS type A sorting domain-containing protein [Bacteroidia bacterium]
MKKGLLFIFLVMTAFTLYSQKDTVMYSSSFSGREYLREGNNTNITIYPVPVKENNFTIKSEKEISFVKITNIIGQDIYKNRYSNLQTIRIFLENPKRGMYLVTIIFSDDTRVVKKIMVEETD